MKKIATHTLGCKLNFAETSSLLAKFIEAGWTTVDFDDIADLYVINTCTVTSTAEKKCRTAIHHAVAMNKEAIVAVIGCFAQNEAETVSKIKGVDIVLGNDKKHNLLRYVEAFNTQDPNGTQAGSPAEPTSFQLSYSHSDRTRTFFKIQDGCDYFCTYCAIPFARGRSRSASINDTLQVAKEIASSGAKEVVLTGVNTGTFGHERGETFFQLLQQLDQVEGIERYRFSSIEPNLLTDEIIQFVANSKHFLPHFHIPLQSGSDKVLKMMHRRYDTAFYAELLKKIKNVMPDACIAADIMVGFNGEDDIEFAKVMDYIDSLPISYLHVFTFSERPNTAALRMNGRIEIHKRREHSRRLHTLSERKKKEFYESQQGKTRTVLWESDLKEGMMYGFTDNYIRVRRPYNPELINTITDFTLNTFLTDEEVYENVQQTALHAE